MQYKYCIGMDMAKSSCYGCIYQQQNRMGSWNVDNHQQGLRLLENILQELKIKDKAPVLFCLEHTGSYNHTLVEWIAQQGYHLGLESP